MINKNKKLIYLSLFLLLPFFITFFSLSLISQSQQKDSDSGDNSQSNSKNFKFRYVKNEAFGYGEKLEYNVGYKFITAGTGTLQIMPNPVYRNGRECYDIQFEVKSLESLDWLYRVRDAYSSILDVSGIFPWEFTQKVREGNYKRDYSAFFDQVNHKAKTGDKYHNVTEYIHDIISAFYYVRTLNLASMRKDSTFYLKNFFDDTTFTLGVRIKGKNIAEVDAGKFNCIVVEPLVVQGGLFKSEGSIYVWLTDDERKIPVKVATKIPIGYVEAKLTSYRGVRGPVRAKIKESK